MEENEEVVFDHCLSRHIYSLNGGARMNRVIVDDYIIGSPYEIIEVDSKPVERLPHGLIVTYVPLALLPVGEHKLKLKHHSRSRDRD